MDRPAVLEIFDGDDHRFKQEPGLPYFIRAYNPIEDLGFGKPWCVGVQVQQIAPGVRIRKFLREYDNPDDLRVNEMYGPAVLDIDADWRQE
jgi:hypothetical protein